MTEKAGKKRSGAIFYLVTGILIALVIAVAYYQEQIAYFIQLRMWDNAAPARTVVQFLSAVKKGDQQEAGRFLAIEGAKPVEKDGKWDGYSYVAQNLPYHISLTDVAPPGEPAADNAEFITRGRGAAVVMAPGKDGKPIKYRLEVRGGDWKITEIGAASRGT